MIGAGWTDNLTGTIGTGGPGVIVSLGGSSEGFSVSGGVYTNAQGGGSTLTLAGQTYIYTTAAGVVIVFNKALAASVPFAYADQGRPVTATYPDGKVVTWTYQQVTVQGVTGTRLQSVTNNLGYQIKFTYVLDTPVTSADLTAWSTVASVTGINNAVDYCAPAANSCSGLTQAWPTLTYASAAGPPATVSVTDALNQVSQFTYDARGRLTGIMRPSAGANTTGVVYDASGRVVAVNNSAKTVGPTGGGPGFWLYGYTDVANTRTTVVTDPLGHTRTVVSNLTTSLASSDTDGLGRTTSYLYDSFGRLTQVTRPETDYTTLAYDGRGNVTTTTVFPNNGPGHGSIQTSASYDATCAQPAKCNQPNYVLDANGNRTDYVYDTIRGVPLSVTAPPPTTGATRPQSRMSYSLLYAWYKNSGGALVQAPTPVFLLTGTSACQTLATCSGTGDEVVSSIAYGSSGVANNLGPTAASAGPGNGAPLTTASQAYDPFGNIATKVGPLGVAQTTAYFYNALRQVSGVIGPEPAGKTKYPALRYSYSPNSQLTLAERGTTTSQANLSSFVALEQQAVAYDALGRKTQSSFAAGGTTWYLTQYTFDNANRLACTAVRMNPAAFASPPASACILGTAGSAGPDLITLNSYDAADELTRVTTGYLTTQQADYATMTYSANGHLATVKDASANLTTTVYDPYDRVSQVQYPLPTIGSNASNPADYEAFSYDSSGNALTARRRSGETITLTYDALNRLTLKHFPVGTEQDVYYAYDLLSRGLYAHFGSTSGPGVDNAYDALGRVTSATALSRTLAYQYDAASNRTRITWPETGANALYVQYVYDVLNRVTAVEENGATSGVGLLASYAYDDLGRRTSITRAGGSGAATTIAYDGADRPSSLTQNLAGTANDVTWGLSYSPAGQLGPRTATNDAYSYHAALRSLPATTNGLNQVASFAGASFSYDGRGNQTANGSNTFTYDLENHLLTVALPSAVTYAYDPLGRLQTSTVGGAATTFLYDGDNLVGEYDGSGNILARHVSGPGVDEPVVSYSGPGTANRAFLLADNTNSIVATTDASGNLGTAIGYSPYGESSAWTASRFGFTGQIVIPGARFYSYKARVYEPVTGRFEQTDPIGIASDINLYAYAGNDPVNGSDPSGLGATNSHVGCPSTCGLSLGAATPIAGVDVIARGLDPVAAVAQYQNGQAALASAAFGGVNTGSAEVSEFVVTARRLFPQFGVHLIRIGGLPQSGQTHAAKMSEEEQEAAAEADDKICRMMKTRECWESAAERRAARAGGRPLPPLRTGVKDNWSGRDVAAGAGAVVIVGGVVCLVVEPCGAAVGVAAVLGGGAVLLGN